MKSFVWTVIVALGLGSAVCFSANPPAAPAPIRLAILPGEGERAPAEEVIAQLEVALTNEKDVTLLERAQVRKILAEQKLSASGLSDPATAVKLGTLIPVELFFFIERMPKVNPPICRVQVIEARTGIVLAGDLLEEKQIGAETAPCLALVGQGARKQAIAPAGRHYVGVLGVRNEEPGRSLDGLAEALTFLLASDLGHVAEVFLLDREHMEWLTRERSLTDTETELRRSLVVVEGGVRRVVGKALVEATLVLRPIAGGQQQTLAVTWPTGDTLSGRREIVQAILNALRVRASSTDPGDPAREAALLDQQVYYRTVARDFSGGVRAGEAAYALAPDENRRRNLILALNNMVLPRTRFESATDSDKAISLHALIRRCSLECLEPTRQGTSVAQPSEAPSTAIAASSYEAAVRLDIMSLSVPPNMAELRSEAAEGLVQAYRHRESVMPETRSSIQDRAFLTTHGAIIALRIADPGNGEEKAKVLQKVIQTWTCPPGLSKSKILLGGFQIINSLPQHNVLQDRALVQQDQAAYAAFFRQVGAETDLPHLSFIADLALVRMGQADSAMVIKTCDFMVQEAASFTEYAGDQIKGDWEREWPRWTRLAIGATEPTKRCVYYEKLLTPWLDNPAEAARLSAWFDLLAAWAMALARDHRKEDGVTLVERAQNTFRAAQELFPTQRWPKSRLEQLDDLLFALGRPPANPDSAWDGYAIDRLTLQTGTKVACVNGDLLYCAVLRRNGGLGIDVYRLPAGNMVTQWTAPPPCDKGGPASAAWTMAMGPDELYLPVQSGLLAFDLKTGKGRVITEEEGLPGKPITTLAWLGDRLYMAIEASVVLGDRMGKKTGLAACDPRTGASEIIVSSVGMHDRTEYPGSDPISAILPDPERKCLWIVATRSGLWQYTPETGKATKVFSHRFPVGLFKTWRIGDQLCWHEVPVGIVAADLSTLRREWIIGSSKSGHPADFTEPATFGYHRDLDQPLFYDGTDVLARSGFNGNLTLLRNGHDPMKHPQIMGVARFLWTTHGVLVFTSGKELYLLRRKDAPTSQQIKVP